MEIIKNKNFQKSLILALFLSFANMLVGFNAVQFYLQTILASTDTSLRDEFGSIIVGMIQLAGSIFTSLISDRFGRKPIFMVTSVGMSLGLVSHLKKMIILKEIAKRILLKVIFPVVRVD